jgi:hypothetical protein
MLVVHMQPDVCRSAERVGGRTAIAHDLLGECNVVNHFTPVQRELEVQLLVVNHYIVVAILLGLFKVCQCIGMLAYMVIRQPSGKVRHGRVGILADAFCVRDRLCRTSGW